MLNDVAQRMLVMMDLGVAVPGAIVAANVPRALANLQQALSQLPEPDEPVDDTDQDPPPVSLQTRAFPLLELLRAAIAEDELVRWD